MDMKIKTYIFYEIGDSCRSEFLMGNNEFHPTEDAVVVGIVKGKNAKDAFENLKQECPYLKNYKFDHLVAREAGDAVHL